ncbi:MAG TPA: formyltetrahydrofolate deformylase [Solirubrobacteraceae bacterium]|jgi:formyltetrahydrofolate deformylase|nr:formyltetrahydrofolate deformylase [Solirubrobacteraceae bacterium]
MSLSPAAPPRGADHTARLLISCPDGPGIVAAISSFLFDAGANIVANDQYSTHPEHGTFFMRAAFYLPAIEASDARAAFELAFEELAARFAMQWRIAYAHERRRVALMASREDHCLFDLLWRQRRGELDMDIECVISNHDDSRAEVEALGVRYHHIPVTPRDKGPSEARTLELLAGRVELVILARYMQILTAGFLERVACPVINIHHSFLPAFAGAEPYRRAYDRGVKLIGATAHYATAELDAGPIIEQDVQRVGHGYTLEDLVRVGRDLERLVLARAVRSHLDDRVLVHEGRTIVF